MKKNIKIAVEKLEEGDVFTLGGEKYVVTENPFTDRKNQTVEVRFIASDLVAAAAVGYRQLWSARKGTRVKVRRAN